jgi:NTP pyrophosphatase (non-canonical NTP hydrolase)
MARPLPSAADECVLEPPALGEFDGEDQHSAPTSEPWGSGGSLKASSLESGAMNLNDYQQAALRTAAPRDKPNELFHLLLGLVGETGEIAEKAKKIVRDKASDFSQWDTEDLKKELGDTLWYVAVIADYFDVPLEDVAQLNVDKLADRQKRGMISGSGDVR